LYWLVSVRFERADSVQGSDSDAFYVATDRPSMFFALVTCT